MSLSIRSRFAWILVALAALLGLGWWWRSSGGTPSDGEVARRDDGAERASANAASSSTAASARTSAAPESVARRRSIRPPEGQASSEEPERAGVLAGMVRSTRTREPVAGAELLFDHLGSLHAVTTSAAGAFDFRPLTEGEYVLTRMEASGYLPFGPEGGQSPISFVARRGRAIRSVTLWLDEAVDYLGVVEDGRGVRVPGASIVRYPSHAGAAEWEAGEPAYVSDDRGEFTFRLALGSMLEAHHPEHGRDRRAVDQEVLTHRRMLFELLADVQGAGESVSGIVVDERGNGVPHALVRARLSHPAAPDNPLDGSVVAAVFADLEGTFELSRLQAGRYELSAASDGYAKASLAGVVAGARGVVLTLGSEVRIAGRVTDFDSGRPVAAFVVLVSEPGLARRQAASLSVFDADGRFEVGDLAANTAYVVNVLAHGYATSPDESVTTAAATEPPRAIHVALGRGAKLVGSVRAVDDRRPIGGADVVLEEHLDDSASATPALVSAETDARGVFELSGAAPGLRSIRVSARGYHSRIVGPFQVPPGNGSVVGPLLVDLSRTAEGEEPGVELFGIGAALRPDVQWFIVERVIAGGGAERAGIIPGDHVLAVDGVEVTALGFEAAVQRIRGPEGTQVLLRVERSGAPADVAVERVRIRG